MILVTEIIRLWLNGVGVISVRIIISLKTNDNLSNGKSWIIWFFLKHLLYTHPVDFNNLTIWIMKSKTQFMSNFTEFWPKVCSIETTQMSIYLLSKNTFISCHRIGNHGKEQAHIQNKWNRLMIDNAFCLDD